MSFRLCRAGCGRPVYGPGARCPMCQAIERANKRADRAIEPRPRRADPNRCPKHLAWIRSLPCCIADCQGAAVAAHVRVCTGGGMGMKPPDRWTVPLCDAHHKEQHRIGHPAFDAKYDIALRDLAERLAALSPHLNDSTEAL